jgi:hypothetical protein
LKPLLVIKKEEVIDCCSELMQHSLTMFIKHNPHSNYNKMAALIGGIDDNSRKPYLYMVHSDNKFEAIKESVFVIGVEPEARKINEIITQILNEHPNEITGVYVNNFSGILREISKGSVHVGQEVFSMEIRNDGQTVYQFINEIGVSVPLPDNFSIY